MLAEVAISARLRDVDDGVGGHGECLSEVGARYVEGVTLAGNLDFEAPRDGSIAFMGGRRD